MTDIEVLLTDLGEIATSDIAKEESTQGLEENIKVARRGVVVVKGARDLYEKETRRTAITNSNTLDYQYQIENEKIKSTE